MQLFFYSSYYLTPWLYSGCFCEFSLACIFVIKARLGWCFRGRADGRGFRNTHSTETFFQLGGRRNCGGTTDGWEFPRLSREWGVDNVPSNNVTVTRVGLTEVPSKLFFKSVVQVRLCKKSVIFRTTPTLFRVQVPPISVLMVFWWRGQTIIVKRCDNSNAPFSK